MTASTVQPGSMAAYGALPGPRVTPELIGLIRTGRVYSLAVVHYAGMPAPEPMVSYTIAPHLRHGDQDVLRPASAAAEVISMSIHVGTHIDALCHIGEQQDAAGNPSADGDVRLYAGENATVRAADYADFRGQRHLTIAEMPPIVTRAVLVDVAGSLGVDVLPDAYSISADEIRAALGQQGTTVTPGTAVLIRTGFYRHLASGNPAYRDAIAGIGLEAAQWLHAQGMILAGADNMTVEALPPAQHPVHRYLLVHNGVTHLENLYLEELAANRVYEFLLIVTPLRLTGATGSWVHPIAIA
ncbi:MAG: cyclase family protein [Anaerolineae bacterium]